jgi:hypothetical protein
MLLIKKKYIPTDDSRQLAVRLLVTSVGREFINAYQ